MSESEFSALGDMLGSATWSLPQAQEYKNDLAQPTFLSLQPQAASQALVLQPKVDPNSPATQEQWGKVNKMVAWFRNLVFRKHPFPPVLFFALESLGSIFLEIYSLGNLETFRKYSL